MTRTISTLLIATIVIGLAGCSASDGVRMGLNLSRKDSYLKIWLDGQAAKQNKAKKAATGYARFEVPEPVECSPVLKFDIEDPDKFGRITMVSVSIYQKFESDYSHQAEFTIFAEDTNNPQAQMKPMTEYHLGNPPEGFQVMNLTNQEVEGVELIPGNMYMLTLTVKADKSETAQVFFETK